MKKKIITLITAATLVGGTFVGCGEAKDAKPTGSDEIGNSTEFEEGVDSTEIEEVSTELNESSTEIDDSTESGESSDEETVANTLCNVFETNAETVESLDELASLISSDQSLSLLSMTSMPVEPGFLNGFEAEITGFNNGVMVAPMIGTIPFVCYVFETDAPEELISQLEANYQLNWNICTQADEMLVKQYGKYVFFVMSPYTFEE